MVYQKYLHTFFLLVPGFFFQTISIRVVTVALHDLMMHWYAMLPCFLICMAIDHQRLYFSARRMFVYPFCHNEVSNIFKDIIPQYKYTKMWNYTIGDSETNKSTQMKQPNRRKWNYQIDANERLTINKNRRKCHTPTVKVQSFTQSRKNNKFCDVPLSSDNKFL